ncbi:Butyryl-CoA dehydrogenase [Indibacter alkaliphilus LW1]|uniref:Butyryl-CoA dehydrogenase n=1 Tax=Indibacter alkaliphilus (strain CCUG 57479 / KCTC 22604 / LW1) TaxID=1189612 RepID=S2DN54_INDAL|nr:acyl-CoA dehydrogenase family protein [Indibacter alkaliphilus]EOZ98640.1 Butyryl-CoA dehydrogenase [Indibacter alkaliphilus LW1]
MDFSELFINEKLALLLPRYESFVQKHIIPLEQEAVYGSFRGALPKIEELRDLARKDGLFAPHLSEKDGGLGLSLPDFARVSEILGKSPLGHYIFNCQAPDIGNMELLHQFASEELKEKYLKPLQEGKIRSCFAMTEPQHAGSNPKHLSTTAIKIGDEYIINGHKWFTSSADGATFTIVMAVTDPENPNPYQRASMILVPLDNPGYSLVRNIPIMGDEGEDYMSHGEVKFVNCKVPTKNLIGKEGFGFALAQERLGPGRIHHCMRWIGICERAIDLMCKRAISRELDPGKPLASQQTIQNWIAESVAGVKAARMLVLMTAHRIEKEGAKAARTDISTIKFFVSDILMKTLDRSIQVHGALGITDDTILSFWYRHERGARIYDGPDEVHKSVLARETLKKYA